MHAKSLERWRIAESRNARRTLALATGPAVLVALIIVISLLASLPILIGIALAALVVVFSLVVWFTASKAVLAKLQATPADPVRHARLHNLVEGLCLASGLPKPALLVLDDPAVNAISVGRTPADSAIVCTSGLLDLLDRMELEAVMAHELAHIRRRDTTSGCESAVIVGYPALVVPSMRRALVRAAGAGREALADQAAVSLTRYPPGLVSALAKVRAAPSIRPASLSSSTVTMTGHLWLAPLDPSFFAEQPIRGALGLEDRIALLHEL